MTTFGIAKVEELEPTRYPEPDAEAEEPESADETVDNNENVVAPPRQTSDDIMDDLTGQFKLF